MSDYPNVIIPEKHRELLTTQHVAMLTTIRTDGMLSTNPVGFVWDGEHIRISTLKSRLKYKNLVNDPRVAFCIQSARDPMYYVEVRGHATLEDDPDRIAFRKQFMVGSAGAEPPPDLDAPGAERVVIVIHARTVSSPTLYGGRFHRKDG